MGTLILLIIAICLIVTGKGNVVLWTVLGILGVCVLGALIDAGSKGKKPATKWKGSPYFPARRYTGADPEDDEAGISVRVTGTRIDHPHFMSRDDSECSVCGKRFHGETDVCPHCGARFDDVVEDEEEWDEEFDEFEDMEEEGW